MKKMTLKRAQSMVRQYTGGHTTETVEKIATRMVETGECVWHAAAQVCNTDCCCAVCKPRWLTLRF